MYATGRHLALTLEGIEAFDLPAPDVVACDVGTSLYWWRGGAMTADDGYRERIASAPGVLPAAEVRARLDGVAGLSPQDEERQADFKVSYHVDRPLDEGLLAELRRRLAPGRLRLVASHDSVSGRGLLDVLPSEVGKATAIRWVADVLRLSDDEVVFAGDSGNDRDAILAGTRAIVVGNAPSGLRSELRGEATRSGVESRVYFASAPHAEGVVEGLGHFGAWPTPDL